jgi:protoporphyrinogen/coproporphyrinogen III oxidase
MTAREGQGQPVKSSSALRASTRDRVTGGAFRRTTRVGHDGRVSDAVVAVVGGGIAGLAAAYAVHREAPPGTRVIVVEGAAELGGKLRVSPVAGLPVDAGAEMVLARAPEGVGLIRAVGLDGMLTHPVTAQASVVVDGRPRPIPTSTVLGVPGDVGAVRAAGVLSESGLAALTTGAERPADPPGPDVAVGEYVARALGREVVDRLVDPLLGGVYAGRADLLSLRATMPALAAVLDGATADRRSLAAAARTVLADWSGQPGSVFATLTGGLGTLPAAVARAAGAEVRVGLPVRRMEQAGRGFRLVAGSAASPTVLAADAVVVAVPAAKAAGMLTAVAPAAARELAAIEYASMAIVTLAYPGSAASRLTGSGLLVPAAEGRAVKAVTFSSAKWAHLAGGVAVVRASVGRFGEQQVLHRDDADLVRLVEREVAALTGVAAAPIEARVTRWGGALPQYAVGHVDRVARIRTEVAAIPGLAVCGAAYDGVGIPACIASGDKAAARVVAHLAAARAGKAESGHGRRQAGA